MKAGKLKTLPLIIAAALSTLNGFAQQPKEDKPLTDFTSAFLDLRYSNTHFYSGDPIIENRGGGAAVSINYEGALIGAFAGDVKRFLIADYIEAGFGFGGQSTRHRELNTNEWQKWASASMFGGDYELAGGLQGVLRVTDDISLGARLYWGGYFNTVRWSADYGGHGQTEDYGWYFSPHIGYKNFHLSYARNISKHPNAFLPPVSRITLKMVLPHSNRNIIGLRTEFASGDKELWMAGITKSYSYSLYSVWVMYGWMLQ